MVFETLSTKMQKLIKEKGLVEPTLPQKMGIPLITKGNNVLIIAPTGIGKCVSGDTVVFTDGGPEEIQNLYAKQINTNSLEKDLKVRFRTGAVIRKRKSKLYELKTNTGRSVKVTDDHKFLTIENGVLIWKELRNLKVSDYIACAKKLALAEKEAFLSLDAIDEKYSEITAKTSPSVKELYAKCKLKTKFGTRRLAQLIGCHRVTLMTSIKGRFLGIKYIKNLAEVSGIPLNEIKILEISAPAAKPIKLEIDEEFAYFTGLFAGDGNFNQNSNLRISTASKSVRAFTQQYCKKLGLLFNKDRSKKYDYYFPSRALYVVLSSLGIPDKNKSRDVRLPRIFFRNKRLLSAFLRGLFDTDGSVYKNTIELTSKSEKLIGDVCLALLCFGIFSRIKEKEVEGYGKYYRMFIQDNKNMSLFLSKIRFREISKNGRLVKITKKCYNPNLDVVPNIGGCLKTCKTKMEVPYSRSHLSRLYESYAYNSRNPSSPSLLKVLDFFQAEAASQNEAEEFHFLRNLANSDIFWDRVVSIKYHGEDYVYDATVPGSHNFIGNGIILHNTETAMLPLLDKISMQNSEPISMLYITPLRALNRDLLDRLYWWGDKLDVEIAVRHGDTSQRERASQREAPPHVLITTPETLQAIQPGKKLREHLKNVKHVVVDEIHELVESKRGVQLSLALERLRLLTGGFQTVALSATVGSPERVAEFIGGAEIIRAEHEKAYRIAVESPKPSARDGAISENLVIGAETTARLRRLYDLIKSHASVLVFTNTRETAEVLSSRLRSLDRELKQEVHHGSLSKERRVASEQRFKQQQLRSLVATSSLELGIDIGSIDLVVQYLSPRQVARLIQRVGRAGHRVGAVSRGVVLSGDEDVFEATVIANRAMRKQIEGVRIHEGAMDVLAMQVAGLAIDEYSIDGRKVFDTIRRAYPYRNVSREAFDDLVRFMEQLKLVWINEHDGGYTIKRRYKSTPYYFENLSTIPDTIQYRVVSIVEHEPIGTLDEAFVAEHGTAGSKFVVAGRAWRILSVDGNRVMVEPIEDIESAIPAWEGELIPVPFEVAQEVGELRSYIAKNMSSSAGKKLGPGLQKAYHVDANSAKVMLELVKKQSATHIVPDNKNFLIESYKDFVIVHSCCGSLANATLGRYLSAKLSQETGVAVNMKTDPYRIILQSVAKRDRIKSLLEEADSLQEFLEPELERSTMFRWRFLHVARRFGIVSRNARFGRLNMNKIIGQYAGTPVYREAMRELQHDKMDFAAAERVAALLRKGDIKLHLADGLSALGELGLVQQFSEVMKPRMPEKEIFLAFKRRLLATPVRLVCTHCGGYSVARKVRDCAPQPECPKCGSRLIGAARRRHVAAAELVRKRLAKKPLSAEEQKELAALRRTADLTIVYGKKALVALAGRGIGPQTAARLLSTMREGEEFYKDIFAAEKQFARTKVYWK